MSSCPLSHLPTRSIHLPTHGKLPKHVNHKKITQPIKTKRVPWFINSFQALLIPCVQTWGKWGAIKRPFMTSLRPSTGPGRCRRRRLPLLLSGRTRTSDFVFRGMTRLREACDCFFVKEIIPLSFNLFLFQVVLFLVLFAFPIRRLCGFFDSRIGNNFDHRLGWDRIG